MHATWAITKSLLLLAQVVSASSERYCEGRWEELSSAQSSFMNYTLHGARTTFDYNDPKATILAYAKEACPAQEARYSCYLRADDLQRSRKQEEIHFAPFDRRACAPFAPAAFLERVHGRRVVVVGDSVGGQLWYSLVCALYRTEESHLHVHNPEAPIDCKRASGRCPIAPNPYTDKPNPQLTHVQAGYLRFRDSNASLEFVHFQRMFSPAELARQRLTPNDIVVLQIGIHYKHEDEFRSEYEQLAKWMGEQTALPIFLVMHPSPQHFHTPNGYYSAGETSGDVNNPRCFPLQERNESTAKTHWRSRLIDEIFEPLAQQKKAFVVPIAAGLNERHDAHMGWGDCTHWCYPSNIFKYMHLMIFNALRRVLPHNKRRKHKAPSTGGADMSYKLHPALRTGVLVQFRGERGIYYVHNGTLRLFENWDAFSTHGFQIGNVVILERFEEGSVTFGESIDVHTKLN